MNDWPAQSIGRGYDGVGNRTALVYPDGGVASYLHDDLDRVAEVQVDAAQVVTVQYAGRRMLKRTAANGIELNVTYDPVKRPLDYVHSWTAGGGVASGFRYR